MDAQDGSERVYIRHGKDFQLLGDYRKAIEWSCEKHLKSAIKIGDRGGEGGTWKSR